MDVNSVVVGAGVVGLATARELARAGREVWVLEANERPGEGISSRNSGVIHAGMYYPTDSLKARCCVRGKALLYDYCRARGVAHRQTGKLIVATSDEQLPKLRKLQQQAAINGVAVSWLERDAALALAPGLRCAAALDSPSTGIVDAAELVVALQGDVEAAGGKLLTRIQVQSATLRGGQWRVTTDQGTLTCRNLVNAAGLGAQALATSMDGYPSALLPRLHYGQGHYYSLRGASPFQQLIYPLPPAASLGVHLGLDLAGRCRFGPDLRWVDKPDYRFDDSQREQFIAAIRDWWPDVPADDLQPDFVGIRPKLHGPNQPQSDFQLLGPAEHGMSGLVQLFGIESPGLTSAMALAVEVTARLSEP